MKHRIFVITRDQNREKLCVLPLFLSFAAVSVNEYSESDCADDAKHTNPKDNLFDQADEDFLYRKALGRAVSEAAKSVLGDGVRHRCVAMGFYRDGKFIRCEVKNPNGRIFGRGFTEIGCKTTCEKFQSRDE